MSEDKIRRFGKWTSAAMLSYVRETLLSKTGLHVAKAVTQATAGRIGDAAATTGVGEQRGEKRGAKWRRFAGGSSSQVG